MIRGDGQTTMSKPLVLIENWAVVRKGSYLDFQEILPGYVLTGKPFGHSKLPNARSIYTSPILSVDSNEGRVETRNTIYQLGAVSAEYENWERQRRSMVA
jgi:hypothetical protein